MVFSGGAEPGFLRAMCAALGRPELAGIGVSFAAEEQAALKRELEIEFERRSSDELEALFAGIDACVEPVLSFSEATKHPHIQAREMLAQVPRGDGSAQLQMACPMKFSEGLPAPRHIGVAVGAHSAQVLAEAGFSAQEIESMSEAGVFG